MLSWWKPDSARLCLPWGLARPFLDKVLLASVCPDPASRLRLTLLAGFSLSSSAIP